MWSSHHKLTRLRTVHVICISMQEDNRRFYCIKYQMKLDFSRNSGQCNSKSQNTSFFDSCFLAARATAIIFVYHKKGEYLVNSWSSVRRAVQLEVPTNFILYVFTLMLVLLSYHRCVSRFGPTFDKIAFNFRHVTLRIFRSLIEGILHS